MSKKLIRYIFGFFLFLWQTNAFAQKEFSNGEKSEGKSVKSDFHQLADVYNKKEKKPFYILKTDTKGILYGNPCVREETRKLGFEYLIACNTKPSGNEKVRMYFYNMGTNTVMLWRHGPFWKRNLRKKIASCRQRTGDFTW